MALHSFALQQAIFTALDGATINDADGNAITGVFDDVPENTAYPYVVIGEETATNIDTKHKAQIKKYIKLYRLRFFKINFINNE